MSLARCPELGTKPITLTVKLKKPPAEGISLGESMKELYRQGALTDIDLVCCEKHYAAHCVVLAAQSPIFRQQIQALLPPATGGRPQLRLQDIFNPEALKFMLDFLYEVDDAELAEFNPRTQDINKDILSLSRSFQLPGLAERAVRWLAKDLTTGNVVERLSICDEYGLTELREKILEQLTSNRQAMAEVAHSPQIMTYPGLMQAMLQHASAAPDTTPPPTKRGRKAGA